MIEFPGSKINLGLNILERLENGYHSLESVFIPLNYSDILEVLPTTASSSEFIFKGIPIDAPLEKNLIYKAWKRLEQDHSIPPFKSVLYKALPMGAGIGGGSADASAMLRLLNQYAKLNLSTTELQAYAKDLGADCPFFIESEARYVRGIGEIFDTIVIDLKGYYIKLILPGIHINTQEAFSAIKPFKRERSIKQNIENNPISEWKNLLSNDFEAYAFTQHKELKEIKEELYAKGAIYASMSGSGSTVYGIFDRDVSALKIKHYKDHCEAL